MKLLKAVLLPNSLQYHVDNGLSLYENVYRYSSDAFVNLFTEARTALREGKIKLNEEDLKLLNETDIGLYGMYEGQKVPLDLPMVDEYHGDGLNKISDDELMSLMPILPKGYVGKNIGTRKYIITTPDGEDIILTRSIDKKNWFYEPSNVALKILVDKLFEAEYRGKDVPLNKPKRGGPKKFYVYTKNKKGNVVKVNFGGTTGLNVKIDEPGARASFAARHKCAQKKDKTKPGYWACNIGRYWKSLGGKRNFSGYW